MNDPTVEHFNTVERELRYIEHLNSLRVFFSSINNSTVYGKTDANWGGDVHGRRSTSG